MNISRPAAGRWVDPLERGEQQTWASLELPKGREEGVRLASMTDERKAGLWETFRRLGRDRQPFCPAPLRAHQFSDTEEGLFEARILTSLGKRRRAFLQTVAQRTAAGSIKSQKWYSRDIYVEPPMVTFAHPVAGEVKVELRPREQPGLFQTACFSVSTRGAVAMAPEIRSLLDRFREALSSIEAGFSESGGFPEWMLARGGAEIVYCPASRSVEVRPSLECNHRCGFCNSIARSTPANVIDRSEWVSLLDSTEPLRLRTFVITGGEPTLMGDLDQMVAAASGRGYTVELQTNGVALADPVYTHHLREAGLRLACVSLHSADSTTSDTSITHSHGAWKRTVTGVDQCLNMGLRVDLSHVIHTTNREGTLDFFDFVYRRWGRRVPIRLAFVAPTGGARDAIREYVPQIPSVLPGLKLALEFAHKVKLPVTLVAYCGLPPCLLADYAHFSETVSRPSRHGVSSDHVKPETCSRCTYDPFCPGLWAEYVSLYGDPGVRPIERRL